MSILTPKKQEILLPSLKPRSHIHRSPPRFCYGLNLTDDPGNANFRSPIRMHYIRMIKYYYVWLRMQYGKLRTNTDCHKCTSVANPASSPWMCDLGIRRLGKNKGWYFMLIVWQTINMLYQGLFCFFNPSWIFMLGSTHYE